ncbi:unnamed protein product [Allacma fusca]|uniref:Golgi SNAP receptor complex member 1 n=1 Tax=Allacma fusca TaxID=39272 RepID=A0A8J2K7Z5_9HEXA|nr:unnamed protein product [Allacma fusca]
MPNVHKGCALVGLNWKWNVGLEVLGNKGIEIKRVRDSRLHHHFTSRVFIRNVFITHHIFVTVYHLLKYQTVVETEWKLHVRHSLKVGGSGTMDHKYSWEDLRKEALYLENEIDSKLVSYSKIGASTVVYVNESDRMFESLSEEIQGLLGKLNHVNEEMTTIASSTPGLSTTAVIHTIQRHREIFQDYSQEFRKTQTNLRSRREREELLQGVRKEIDSSKNSLSRRMDLYMKEHDHLKSSERMVDEQISIAIDTKENLISCNQ